MTNHTAAGTIGGTILSVVAIPTQTIFTTIVVAIIGATVSFLTSLVLKELYKHITKKK